MIELREVTKEYSKGVAALNGINLKIDLAYHERTGTYFGNDYCKWQ